MAGEAAGEVAGVVAMMVGVLAVEQAMMVVLPEAASAETQDEEQQAPVPMVGLQVVAPMVGVLAAVSQAATAVLAAKAAMVMVVVMYSPARDQQTPAQSKSHRPSRSPKRACRPPPPSADSAPCSRSHAARS